MATTTRELTPLDEAIMEWERSASQLATAKEKEMTLRNKVVALAFPGATMGTNNLDLGNGYKLKFVKKVNLNLKHTREGQETDHVLEQIEKLGTEGQFIADRIVSWKPTLSVTEYKSLVVAGPNPNPTHLKIKTLIDSVLTVTDAAPELELIAPK